MTRYKCTWLGCDAVFDDAISAIYHLASAGHIKHLETEEILKCIEEEE